MLRRRLRPDLQEVPVAKRPSKPLPASYARGREAEDAAVARLAANGFRILWRNARIGSLEIDIVAAKGDLAVIVEVRTRGAGSFAGALASIDRPKRLHLLRAARALWRGRLKKMTAIRRVRIDVASVTFEDGAAPTVEWIAGAITENDA